MYEVAAFEALNNGLRSGDLYVVGSRRYQTFESYLLSKEHWAQLKDTGQTRVELKRAMLHLQIIRLPQLVDPSLADVTPRSNKVAENQQPGCHLRFSVELHGSHRTTRLRT